jgi:hypothetical protein
MTNAQATAAPAAARIVALVGRGIVIAMTRRRSMDGVSAIVM